MVITVKSLVLALVASLTVAVAAGCGGGDSSAIELTRERDGVRIKISANKVFYDPGDEVRVKAEVENLRSSSLVYGYVPASEPGLQITIDTAYSGVQILNSTDDGIGEAGAATLAAGAKLEAEAEWDQMLDIYTTPQQAPEGPYVVTARLLVDDPAGGAEPIEISAAVELNLSGGPFIIPPEEAIRIAVQNDEIKAWLAARQSQAVICGYQSADAYFVAQVATAQVDETGADVYNLAISNQRPVCSPVTVGDEWRVQFISSGMLEPTRVAVYMGVNDGSDPRYEVGFEEAVPSPSQ